MASSARVAVIFGAGSNVGASLVDGFLGAGYRVATVSRSKSSTSSTDTYSIQADLSDPKNIPGVFAKLAGAGWPFPSVVIWNAAAMTRPIDPENPLEVPEAGLDRDLDLMIKSPYIAAREAVRTWKQGSDKGRKGTFIMTGNVLPRQILSPPALVNLGIGKSGANYWVGLADMSFKAKGMRFFYIDERKANGGPVGSVPDGPGHAKISLSLVEDEEISHYVTFVDGKHTEFP